MRRRVQNIMELYAHRLHLENLVNRQTQVLKQQAQAAPYIYLFIIDALSTAVEFETESLGSISGGFVESQIAASPFGTVP